MSTLTRDEILAMEAGPGMDAIVHRRVLRRPLLEWHGREGWVSTPTARSIPAYSADIAAAWEVLRQVRGWELSRRCFFYVMLQGAVRHRLGTNGDVLKNGALLLAIEPEDICKAALLLTLTEAE